MTALWFETALLASGWADRVRLTIGGGRIAGIEAGIEPQAGDERRAIGLPGTGNLHSHAFQRAMAGLTERSGQGADSFWTWRTRMYAFLDRLTPEDVEAIAAMTYVETLEAGFTRIGEFHYLHHDAAGQPYADLAEMAGRIAAAAERTGLALTLLPVFYAHSGFGGLEPSHGQRRFINDPDRFAALIDGSRRAVAGLDGAVVGIAPHSLRAATQQELATILPLANGGPIHIHVAEQVKEVEDCLAWSGRRPVAWLLDEMPVDERWCLIHATHVEPQERSGVAASRAVAGLCPITEANLGDGIFPAVEFLGESGSLGVGSDSNVLISLNEELRVLEYGQRLSRRGRTLLAGGPERSTGRALFDAAGAGAAQALGAVGPSLRVGAPADIVALDAADPVFASRNGDALLDSWVFACRGSGVQAVWRAGRRLVEDGRHIAREPIERAFRATMQRLLA